MAGEVTQITTLQGQTVIAAQQAPNILTLADMSTFCPGLRWITSASETWAFTSMVLMSASVRMFGACMPGLPY
jgi:hypothetical protein